MKERILVLTIKNGNKIQYKVNMKETAAQWCKMIIKIHSFYLNFRITKFFPHFFCCMTQLENYLDTFQ